jgi:hypothetical protein
MKKIVILSIALGILVSAQVFSQKWIAGGEAGVTFNSNNTGSVSTSTNSFTFSPLLGYAINNKFDIGVKLIITNDTSNATTFGFAGWGRYGLFGTGNLTLGALGTIGFTNTSYNAGPDLKTFFIGVLPNAEYRLSNHVSVYSNIGGISFERRWSTSNSSNTIFYLGIKDKVDLGFFFRF